MADLNKLYDPLIKAHQANPYHFEKITAPELTIKANNPVCGDNYNLYPEINGGIIVSVYFHGYGCAVSMAASSVLAKTLEGKKIKDAIQLCSIYLDQLDGKNSTTEIPNEFSAFEAVRAFPERYNCAALVWAEMREFLLKQE
ncbi:MAG: SUF system NifU family Fe-S cluster assembly protein [Cyclobacteriaceae bacterium]